MYRVLLFVISLVSISPLSFSQNKSRPFYKETKVFWSGLNGYNYRIPSIIALSNGEIIACAECRKQSLSDDGTIDIVMRKSSDGGLSWSPVKVVAENGNNVAGNPVLVEDKMDSNNLGERMFLFYCISDQSENNIKQGIGIRRVFYKTSIDYGNTWSSPIEITKYVHKPVTMYNKKSAWYWFATGPGHAIQMQYKYKGRLVVPLNHSELNGKYYAGTFFSDDHGKTWQVGDTLAQYSNESQVAELENGSLIINSRIFPQGENRICGISDDGGETWKYVYNNTDLLDAGCEGSIISFSTHNKLRVLFSNANDLSNRVNLSVKISYDEGGSWRFTKTIAKAASAYSDLTVMPDSTIGILFEKDNYQNIVFGNFNLQWLTDNVDSSTSVQHAHFYLPQRIYTTVDDILITNDSQDLSLSNRWVLKNGEPDVSTDRNPYVYFPHEGKYFIKLEQRKNNNVVDSIAKILYIKKGTNESTPIIKENKRYIIEPNPSYSGKVNILLKTHQKFTADAVLISADGMDRRRFIFKDVFEGTIDLNNKKGIFYISIMDNVNNIEGYSIIAR